MKHLRLRIPVAICVCLLLIAAAPLPVSADDADDLLPIGLTAEEKTRLDEIGATRTITAAPPGPIRNCAEWEPSQGVIIRWPLGIPLSLVAEMSEGLTVTTLVASSYEQSQAVSSYTAAGVTMANTDFLIAATNSIWTRDYGPWFIFDGNQNLAIVDHVYNRPRPLDDQIPWELGAAWGLDVYGMNLEHTGGNHMSDGLGVSMSTRLVYDENSGMSHAVVDSLQKAYTGNDYTVLDYIESGGIHHIDCWAKFLDPTTILVKDVPSSSSSYGLLNARAEFLSEQISSWGRPYTIVRVYCPYGTAYTNSIILNDKVLVPTFNSSEDETALQTYRDAMPGYEVLGFDGSWLDDDAIHCRAMGVPDRGMLSILHVPLTTTGDTLNDYLVSATIHAYSGSALIADSLLIYYQDKASLWKSAPLYATAVPDSFYGYLPARRAGGTVSYYLQAADESGRVETHPYIGQPWAHEFYINHAPVITSSDYVECETEAEFRFAPAVSDADDSLLTVTYADYPGWMSVSGDSLGGAAPSTPGTDQFTVAVSDGYSTTTQSVTLEIVAGFVCGDANADGQVNVADAVFIINFVFKGGPEPQPAGAGDANGDATVDIGDAVYLISYVFKGGPAPDCP